jgi:monofunctional biosynthetic peptidoglycan transglycosylase
MNTQRFAIILMVALSLLGLEGTGMATEHDEHQTIRLDDLRWQHRIIVVFGDEGTDFDALQTRFQEQRDGIDERHIRFFLIGDQILSNSSEKLDPQEVSQLREKYARNEQPMSVVLIGKDGGEKYRRTYLDFEEIYREIDAMPMRIQEMQQQEQRTKMLIDFSDQEMRGRWAIVNDSVMGGISQSEIGLSDDNTAIFRGIVSLENYGGFASTRSVADSYDLAGYTGLIVRMKGDGRQYQLRLRADNRFDGVSYRYYVDTQPDTWMTIRVPFGEFVPVFRGRILNDVPPISPGQLQQIGFMIADKKAGPFQLEIESIQAYK